VIVGTCISTWSSLTYHLGPPQSFHISLTLLGLSNRHMGWAWYGNPATLMLIFAGLFILSGIVMLATGKSRTAQTAAAWLTFGAAAATLYVALAVGTPLIPPPGFVEGASTSKGDGVWFCVAGSLLGFTAFVAWAVESFRRPTAVQHSGPTSDPIA